MSGSESIINIIVILFYIYYFDDITSNSNFHLFTLPPSPSTSVVRLQKRFLLLLRLRTMSVQDRHAIADHSRQVRLLHPHYSNRSWLLWYRLKFVERANSKGTVSICKYMLKNKWIYIVILTCMYCIKLTVLTWISRDIATMSTNFPASQRNFITSVHKVDSEFVLPVFERGSFVAMDTSINYYNTDHAHFQTTVSLQDIHSVYVLYYTHTHTHTYIYIY